MLNDSGTNTLIFGEEFSEIVEEIKPRLKTVKQFIRVAEGLGKGQLTDEQRGTLEGLQAESAPMLGYAYGDESSILIAASSENDALSSVLLYMLGMKNPAGLEQLFKGL